MPISSHTLLARVTPLELWSMDIKVDMLPAIRRRENETGYRQILLPTLQPVRLQIRTAATKINGKMTSWRIAMPSFSSNLPIVVVKEEIDSFKMGCEVAGMKSSTLYEGGRKEWGWLGKNLILRCINTSWQDNLFLFISAGAPVLRHCILPCLALLRGILTTPYSYDPPVSHTRPRRDRLFRRELPLIGRASLLPKTD